MLRSIACDCRPSTRRVLRFELLHNAPSSKISFLDEIFATKKSKKGLPQNRENAIAVPPRTQPRYQRVSSARQRVLISDRKGRSFGPTTSLLVVTEKPETIDVSEAALHVKWASGCSQVFLFTFPRVTAVQDGMRDPQLLPQSEKPIILS
jgi:hypothetical protein